MHKNLVKEIIDQKENFSKWYTDICLKAELIAYSDVKGFIIYLPNGYFLWLRIQQFLDQKLKEAKYQNVYFPLMFTTKLFTKEKQHIEGFKPETCIVDRVGDKPLTEHLVIRPTSEVLFSQYYAKKITSYRDLPKLYNQWCNVVRWEKTTRPFLRGKEFLWQEGHTVHSTELEARQEVTLILKFYKQLGKDLLAIPFVMGQKTNLEKFSGAIDTYALEALMPDGQSLQVGTSHFLGTNFSQVFKIQFQDQNCQLKLAYQTSFGISTRLLGALVMVHSDERGLVLPPFLAHYQIVIVPLQLKNPQVLSKAKMIFELLKNKYRIFLDLQSKNVGFKFSHYELQGIPIRIEVGTYSLIEDQVTVFTRYNKFKQKFNLTILLSKIDSLLTIIHENMYQKALQYLETHQFQASTYEEFKNLLKKGGYVAMSISGEEAELKIKNDTQTTARVILQQDLITAYCPVTKQKANYTALFARAY